MKQECESCGETWTTVDKDHIHTCTPTDNWTRQVSSPFKEIELDINSGKTLNIKDLTLSLENGKLPCNKCKEDIDQDPEE